MARLWALLSLLTAAVREAEAQVQPNPPVFPESVQVFGPETDVSIIQAAVNEAYLQNGGHATIDHGQFSSKRYAFLFKPGTYPVDVPVGYYTQVLGLGMYPGDVVFTGKKGPHAEEGDVKDMGGALSTFWRSAENFRTSSAQMLWAVSQAAPLRRIIADGGVQLAQFVGGVGMGYSSGGFVANMQVKGTMLPGSQQQFMTRNSELGKWSGGVWNMAFVGSHGAPAPHCGKEGGIPAVVVDRTPIIAEKPFISVGPDGRYSLHVPPAKRDRVGIDFDAGEAFGFEQVYVARDTDTAEAINARLREGLHLVLSPGTYRLEAPLELDHDNQVILGLGLATLVATSGTPAIRVGNVDGARVAGVLLQAGTLESPSLLEWGDGSHPGTPANPGFMHDVFARVGGPTNPAVEEVRTEVMVRINSGWVVGDNLWLWRADHDLSGLVKNSQNPVRTGLVVTGDNVKMYGLAVEHCLEDQVRWSGDGGSTMFFQSELPYDVTPAFGQAGYVGYRVLENVATHQAHGPGVYHYFRDFPVTVDHGIEVPAWLENSIHSPLAVYLTGKGHMNHVMNSRGGVTAKGAAQVQWSCQPGPEVPVPYPLPTKRTVGLEAPLGSQYPMRGLLRPLGGVTVITDGTSNGQVGLAVAAWVKLLIILPLLVVASLAAYLFRLRLKQAGQGAAAALSPNSAKRAMAMRTPARKTSGMEASPPNVPGLDPALLAAAAESSSQNGSAPEGLWGMMRSMVGCAGTPSGRRSSKLPMNRGMPRQPCAESPAVVRKFPGLSPGQGGAGPSARTLAANASPLFGLQSPFGRRSPWRPEHEV